MTADPAACGATHVLHWVPGYLVRGDSEGWWELQSLADWNEGKPQDNPDWDLIDEPRDLNAGDVTGWIADCVGYPVGVAASSVRITCPRALRFLSEEPVWFVAPALTGGTR